MCLCVDDRYSVPLDVELTVAIKPRSLSGVLLSVFSHGTGPPGGDYLVLQLVNGHVSILLSTLLLYETTKPRFYSFMFVVAMTGVLCLFICVSAAYVILFLCLQLSISVQLITWKHCSVK